MSTKSASSKIYRRCSIVDDDFGRNNEKKYDDVLKKYKMENINCKIRQIE